MNKLAVAGISFYQNILSPILRQLVGVRDVCRFSPSCSEYMKICIGKYGVKKGIKMGAVRILNCLPSGNSYANI